MNERSYKSQSHLFLVRIWRDEQAVEQERWQGKVQHIVTGQAGSFQDWPALVRLITSLASASEVDSAQLEPPGFPP
jgi:hypothetical protein